MATSRRAGLGKSLQSMFGEDKIKKEFLENQKKEENTNRDDFQNRSSIRTNNFQPTNTVNLNEAVEEEVKPEVNEYSQENKSNEYQEKKYETFTEQVEKSSSEEDMKKDAGVIMVKTNLVQPNLNQPRKNFDDEKIEELSESISKYGVLQPLLVKQNGMLYEIIAGERRWRAAKLAGLDMIPVQVKKYDQKTIKEVALVENIQRENLNAVEEALAYQSLIEEYGLSQEEVAQRVSKNRSTITNSLRILKLNPTVLEMIKSGKLSQGHARALLSIEDEELREKIAKRVIDENLSVREIEQIVKMEKLSEYKKNKPKLTETEEARQLKIIIKDLEKKLKQKLNTKVRIVQKDDNKGRIEIEYYNKEELDRLFLLMNSN